MSEANTAQVVPITGEHLEILQEFTNIAVGRSAAALAELLDMFVTLTVPRVEIVTTEEVYRILTAFSEEGTGACAVEQLFRGDLNGQAIMVMSNRGLANLRTALLSPEEIEDLGEDEAKREVLLEVGNLVISSATGMLIELLGGQMAFAPPRVLLEGLQAPSDAKTRPALLVDTRLETAEIGVEGRVAVIQDPNSSEWLGESLERAVEELSK